MKHLFLMFVCLAASGCLPDTNSNNHGFIRIEIAERVFKIPKGYLDGRRATGRITESVVLEYSLPDFEVLPPHPQERAARMRLITTGRMNSMLLEASSDRPSFDVMIKNYREITGRIGQFQKNIYGLNKYSVLDWDGRMTVQPNDTFIEGTEDDGVISFVSCSPPGKDKNPGCRHKFRDKGLLYQINWAIGELPNWQEQQKAAIDFIDSFEVKEEE